MKISAFGFVMLPDGAAAYVAEAAIKNVGRALLKPGKPRGFHNPTLDYA